MATTIAMPSLGMVMTEGTLARWLKPHGEQVQQGEAVAEITTDKLNFEIEAPVAGVLFQVAKEGDVVEVERPLAYLLAPGEAPPETGAPPASIPQAPAAPTFAPVPPPAPVSGEVRATPVARRLAAQHGIDVAAVRGTGPGGRIVEQDVLRAVAEQEQAGQRAAAPAAAAEPLVAQRLPLQGARGVIARRMTESLRESAQLTLTIEADASALAALPTTPGAVDAALLHAAALALREFPIFNSTVRDGNILVFEEINIGVAVALGDTLLVPVVRRADAKTATEISRELRELMRRERNNQLTPDDLAGGTFTVSNLGGQHVDIFTPIINPPQSAILGVGRIMERPAAVAGRVEARPTVWLSLTFDHRVADGAPAARFLNRIAGLIARPDAANGG